MHHFCTIALFQQASLALVSLFLCAGAARASDGVSLYVEQIKPLLEHKCYACHGALRQQGGLRLDTVASMKRGGDSGPAIDSQQPQKSLLLEVLTGAAGFQMPPANEGAPFSAEEIRVVRRWLAQAAPAPEQEAPQANPQTWWSYQPVERPELPAVANEAWCRTPVDVFVAAQREAAGLSPAAPAPRAEWLRRVTLDLTGLPPTRDELTAFLADDSPTAYERVVDGLLERPEYGERWGRHWMDIWRYSDWYGSRGGNEIRYSQRHIWRWRDWIIQSLNQDVGYDEMVRQMLAADELADEDVRQLAATGYLGRNWYKFDRDVWLFDTVERTSEALLGVRMRCCRCHDHKFEPITQLEYYQLRAFFEPHDVRIDPIRAAAPKVKDAKLGEVLGDGIPLVYDRDPEAPTYRFERGDNRYPDKSTPLSPGVPASLASMCPPVQPQKTTLSPLVWYPALRPKLSKSLVRQAEQQVAAAMEKLAASERALTAARKASLSDKAAPEQAPEKAPAAILHDDFTQRPELADKWKVVQGDWVRRDGKLIQSQISSFATIVTKDNQPENFRVRLRYRALPAGSYRSIGFSFDYQDQGNSQDVYTSTGDDRQSVQAFHRLDGKQVYPPAGIVPVKLAVGAETELDVRVEGKRLAIHLNGLKKLEYRLPVARRPGKFALWVHQGAAEFLDLKLDALPASPASLQDQLEQRQQEKEVAAAELAVATAERDSLSKRLFADYQRYVVTADEESIAAAVQDAAAAERLTAEKRADLKSLQQGSKADPSGAAGRAPNNAEFSPVGEQYARTSTGRRSALAAWITSPQNPRTSRVAANHLWGRHFGEPLVATTENFGLNGQQPTHPQLLDWLATELMRHQWRMKPLHRQLVLSATYRMTSKAESSAAAADNRLYWRMNSRRMEAEVVRDSVLALSGQLDPSMGGPEIPESQGESVPRRSVYFRLTPNEKMKMLEVFDVADPNECYRRKENVAPHQSLAMMNSATVQAASRRLTQRLTRRLSAESDSAAFVRIAFETVLCRSPTADERRACESFLESHVQLLASQEGQSDRFPAGPRTDPAPADQPAVRARENLVHVLLMHNDFVTIR